jgi:hypothetical protein
MGFFIRTNRVIEAAGRDIVRCRRLRQAASEMLDRSSHGQKPVSGALILPDSDFRRYEGVSLDQRFPELNRG